MKFSYLLLVLMFAFSCQEEATKEDDVSHVGPIVIVHNGGVAGSAGDDSLQSNQPKFGPNDGILKCNFLGESEFGVPQNSVYVAINGTQKSIGKCDACKTIDKSEFSNYEIPSNAISACGGWWAGAGDYFYTVKNENGEIEVFFGWQDEGQIENDDTSFHWKRTHTYK